MPKIWDLPHVGDLTGTMRIAVDKTDGGTANDTAHFTPDDVVAYVEDNADLGGGTPSDADPADLGTAAPGVATAYSRGDHVHQAPTPASIGAATVAEAGNALTAAQLAQTTADDAATAATAAQGTADNAVSAAGVAQAAADAAQSDATQALSDAAAAQATANAALPKPGGTTTANGIAYGTGTTGAAVAISTTTIADLVKRLGNVFTLNADTVLDDSYSGAIIFTDTSGGARSHTIPTTVSAGWNAIFVREGANTLNVIGDGTMLMAGPAAVANAVAIAVDNGGVSVIRRSATKCWCAGVIA